VRRLDFIFVTSFSWALAFDRCWIVHQFTNLALVQFFIMQLLFALLQVHEA
jgi:hypothetical protein